MLRTEAAADLDAVRRNVELLRAGTAADLLAVVKADGYGHGLLPSARAALAGGASWLGSPRRTRLSTVPTCSRSNCGRCSRPQAAKANGWLATTLVDHRRCPARALIGLPHCGRSWSWLGRLVRPEGAGGVGLTD